MRKLSGAATFISRPDRITDEERAAIEAETRKHPNTRAADDKIAAMFGRSHVTIKKIRHKWQRAEGVPKAMHQYLGKNRREPTRMNKALEFAKAYKKPFTVRVARQYIGSSPSDASMFSRLVAKGFFTSKKVTMHIRRCDGVLTPMKVLVFWPTDLLFEE